jgi:hypothetical protein
VIDQGGNHGTHELIDAARGAGVKLWQVLGTGLDHTDVAYILKKGIPLANTPGQFSSIALAEHAVFLMLLFAKKFFDSQRSVRNQVLCEPMNEELQERPLTSRWRQWPRTGDVRTPWACGSWPSTWFIPPSVQERYGWRLWQARRTAAAAGRIRLSLGSYAVDEATTYAGWCSSLAMKPSAVIINSPVAVIDGRLWPRRCRPVIRAGLMFFLKNRNPKHLPPRLPMSWLLLSPA